MLRFAPRYGIVAPALVRPSRQPRRFAANDNAQLPARVSLTAANADHDDAFATIAAPLVLGDARVQAALRLFAAHGLSAAERARGEAANADARGDEQHAQWWTEISHMLGQRHAEPGRNGRG